MDTKQNKYQEILVISVGATPQIVTETLWYYTHNKIRKFDRIVLITTAAGRDKIEMELFDNSRLSKLEKALSIKSGSFIIEDPDIIVLEDSEGNPLDDIRSSDDCEDMSKHIFNLMNGLTNENNSRLTIVIAGGRKTMPATLALASSVYGRDQDEMVHVLIDDALFWTDWYYPDDPDDPKQQIEISQIPYLRLKNYTTGIKSTDPSDILSLAQTRLNELSPVNEIIIDKSTIKVGDQVYKFPPAEMQVWRYIARKKIENCENPKMQYCISCKGCLVTHEELVDEFDNKVADEYFSIVKNGSANQERREIEINKRKNLKAHESSFEIDTRVRELKSKLKRNIRERIEDLRVYNALQIVEVPFKDDSTVIGYGLSIDRNAITIEC